MNNIQLLVSIPELIFWLLFIAGVAGMAWWSLREDK